MGEQKVTPVTEEGRSLHGQRSGENTTLVQGLGQTSKVLGFLDRVSLGWILYEEVLLTTLGEQVLAAADAFVAALGTVEAWD